jgi:hypothetical protein
MAALANFQQVVLDRRGFGEAAAAHALEGWGSNGT